MEHNPNQAQALRAPRGPAILELEGEPVAELDGCRTDWPIAELDGKPVAKLDGCRADWPIAKLDGKLVAELDGYHIDWLVVELDGKPVVELDGEPDDEMEGEPVAALASMDLIGSYNKAEVEYYCVTKDLRSSSSPVKSMLDSWGQICFCGKNR
ncbi:hypothetical protein Nepgr_010519 [Nepenthes gracilis]|uniref:Uncharacterized protein n=1 Tax=Nepenthes gracilis TaxID=150966 RepID=A0AAD3SD42_NEPGR|nr:hypothetical protein Nepgr_010519 [Nepenthes gracilis]